MTSVAAVIPSPGASAITTSVTDTIQVRVVGSEPLLTVTPDATGQINTPEYKFDVTYENITDLTVSYTKMDADGNIIGSGTIFSDDTLDFNPGAQTFELNLDDEPYGGSGYYTFNLLGHGYNNVPVERELVITYTLVDVDVIPSEDGEISVDIKPTEDTDKIIIEVHDKDGELVRIIVIDPETGTVYVYDGEGHLIDTIEGGYKDGKIDIPMDGLDDGEYTFSVRYEDADGNIIGVPFEFSATYKAKPVPTPDTGAFLQNLNISKQDYLITGLLIFFVFAIVGFGIVARGRKSKVTKKKR